MSRTNLSIKVIKKYCKSALKEDLHPSGDITSKLLKNKKSINAKLIINQSGARKRPLISTLQKQITKEEAKINTHKL